MSEVFDLEAIVQKGLRTEAFRGSQEYRDSVVIAATNLINAFMTLEMSDEDALNVRRQFISLQAIDSQLSNAVDDGVIAQAELEDGKDD